ncbi:MAG: hypothetical protein P4L61_02690 [Candidatus Pacebacteria bacterium]|nr:hypothetical protein [Candidatus Paceibacterota bacterium]
MKHHPWLRYALRLSICGDIGGGSDFKTIVLTKVRSIVPLSYGSLPMDGKDSSTAQSPSDSPDRYLVIEMRKRVRYSIHFKLSGDGRERIAFLNDGKTVGESLAEIRAWFLTCESLQGQTVAVSGIIKESRESSSRTGLLNVDYELYEPVTGERAVLNLPEQASLFPLDAAVNSSIGLTRLPVLV